MRDFFNSWKFKVLVCVLALLIGILLYGGIASASETGSSFFGRMFAPIQRFSSNLSRKVEASLDMLLNADQYYEDNQKLKEQLGELYNQIIDYDKLKEENEQLRRVIGLKEDYPDYEFSPPCSVIGRTSNDPYGSFIIDRGTDDGIAAYDPVITEKGLIGVVSKVSKTYSRVKTILSPDVPVGVYCVRTKDTGVIEGDIEYAGKGLCKMNFIPKGSDIRRGDIVATSGASGVFPADRLVGVVEEVGMEESGLSMYAVIRPAVDSKTVASVFVVTYFNGQGEGYEE